MVIAMECKVLSSLLRDVIKELSMSYKLEWVGLFKWEVVSELSLS